MTSELTRRNFLSLAAATPGLAAPTKRPNIVFLLTDDQAYNAMGCMGNDEIQTPNMDRLGADGVIFDRHYDTTPICMASRASIMTGMYEYKTGCNFMHGSMSEDKFAKSYPVLLRQAGYRTGFAGKFGFAVEPGLSSNVGYNTEDRLPWKEFDWWRGWPGQGNFETAKNRRMLRYAKEYPHVTRALGGAAQEFIRESAGGDEPFSLSISFKAPHKPPVPDPAFDHIYAGKRFSKPPNYGAHGMEHLPTQALLGRQFIQRNEWYPDDVYQERLRQYYQQVYGVDVALGMIRKELEEQGVADNTIIIFTSDNGYFCGSHFMQGKTLPYEEASRAPLIIYDPRHTSAGKGLRAGGVTGNIDMAPTILSLAGEPVPENMDGQNLVPLLSDPSGDVRESLFLIHVWEFDKKCRAFAAVTRDYKYIYWFYGDALTEPAEELYALSEDPYEMKNVVAGSEHRAALLGMYGHYDANLRHWKENVVPGNGYPKYVRLADRNIPWREKEF
jgi:arylsulfatase A-like enzyme